MRLGQIPTWPDRDIHGIVEQRDYKRRDAQMTKLNMSLVSPAPFCFFGVRLRLASPRSN